MQQSPSAARESTPDTAGLRRDAGTSIVEIVAALAILGIVGTAILGGLFTSVQGSKIERDHARAHEWLQSATEVLVNDIEWRDCTAHTAVELQHIYETELQAETAIIPPTWEAYDLRIPFAVEFPDPSGAYGAPCDPDENRQRIRIQVADPSGEIIETVDVVKVP